MAQAEPRNDSASGGGEDRGGCVGEAFPGVPAGEELMTAFGETASSSAEPCRYVMAGMSEQKIAATIAKSEQQGWSEVVHGIGDGAGSTSGGLGVDDQLLWQQLKRGQGGFFRDVDEDDVRLGRVIAEGGQALIYEADTKEVHIQFEKRSSLKYVAKVYKSDGFSLAGLHRQWPLISKRKDRLQDNKSPYVETTDDRVGDLIRTTIDRGESRKIYMGTLDQMKNWFPISMREINLGKVAIGTQGSIDCSLAEFGTILKDGRFAFVMPRYWGDLRTLINLKMEDKNNQGPPFPHDQASKILREIVKGMQSLHFSGIMHRDLKAANILIGVRDGDPRYSEDYYCHVADYESSMLVQGTGFWRAPEVLEELLKKPWERNEQVWTESADVYSFAMTCYEVLIGDIPFQGCEKSDWKRVINGERPHLPHYITCSLQYLVTRCWHKVPSKRPSFDVIWEYIYHNRFFF